MSSNGVAKSSRNFPGKLEEKKISASRLRSVVGPILQGAEPYGHTEPPVPFIWFSASIRVLLKPAACRIRACTGNVSVKRAAQEQSAWWRHLSFHLQMFIFGICFWELFSSLLLALIWGKVRGAFSLMGKASLQRVSKEETGHWELWWKVWYKRRNGDQSVEDDKRGIILLTHHLTIFVSPYCLLFHRLNHKLLILKPLSIYPHASHYLPYGSNSCYHSANDANFLLHIC